jgi:alginate O-acetyltransferase complex protein AlgI
MIFSSPRFFIFLATLLVLMALLGADRREFKKRLLGIASCLFYAAWDWRYLGLLLVSSVVDYFAATKISAASDRRIRKAWLTLSIVSNLSILGYFKYCNFFIDNLNSVGSVFGWHINPLHILLPAGISFYTFSTMSYTIDVYRNELKVCRSWLDYTTFITFFPELIAGPIVRGSVLLPQMNRDIGPTVERLKVGSSIFLVGLTKKVLIADRLAGIADPIFTDPSLYSGVSIWFGVLSYSLQIYCDFSGYSDMAIGTAKMIGYDLPENFRMPYSSMNITDFWRRWHITLSTWLRDYLYIPLGGNRVGTRRTYINLLLTMLLGGLWHGASWNFVLWGGLHGSALAVHKWVLSRRKAYNIPVLHPAGGVVSTFLFVSLAWIPFRAASFGDTLLMVRKMFGLGDADGVIWIPHAFFWCLPLVLLGHMIGILIERDADKTRKVFRRGLTFCGLQLRSDPISGSYLVWNMPNLLSLYLLFLWVLVLFFFASTNTSPFIYFQF